MLSSVVALTLAPVLASRLLTATPKPDRGLIAGLGNILAGVYAKTLRIALDMPLVILLGFVLFFVTASPVMLINVRRRFA